MPAVLVADLSVRFGTQRAVDRAHWSAAAGDVTAILGPNGAGKTTTIECLEGLQRPTSGKVTVLGSDPWRAAAEQRARVGVMLQDGGLPTMSRPLPLLHHLASLYADPWPVADLAARLEIPSFAHTRIRRLSGGQRQRVALAAALIGRPDVVFLDEPTAGLDPHARRETWSLIRSVADTGAAVVMSTHSFEEAERLADRIVIMADGTVRAEGSSAEVAGESGLEERYFALTAKDAS